MKNKLIKGLTLFCFIGFILIFIAYRSGKIEPIIQSSPNGESINASYKDSLFIKDSFETNEIMSSSKSIAVFPHKQKNKDTLPIQTIDMIPDSVMEDFMLMSSSKSMKIIDKPFLSDSLKKYTNQNLK